MATKLKMTSKYKNGYISAIMALIFFGIKTGGNRTDSKNTAMSKKDYLQWKKTQHRIEKRRRP